MKHFTSFFISSDITKLSKEQQIGLKGGHQNTSNPYMPPPPSNGSPYGRE